MILLAQVDTAWVRTYNGPISWEDSATGVGVDRFGDVYVTGISVGSDSLPDYVTVKYSAAGLLQWVRRYSGPNRSQDFTAGLVVDAAGNAIVAGHSVHDGMSECVTIKYSPAGDTLWLRKIDGMGHGSVATAVAADDSANVYVAGMCQDSLGSRHCLTIRYRSSGDMLWARTYRGGPVGPWSVADVGLDGYGNIYIAGTTGGTASDFFVTKYNPAGETLWTCNCDGQGNSYDLATDMDVDSIGNVAVTGSMQHSGSPFDFLTVRLNPQGGIVWKSIYDNPSYARARSTAIDRLGNVYVAGFGYAATCDFLVVKYAITGDTLWVRRYDGPVSGFDYARRLVSDSAGNVYVSGESEGSGTAADFVTIKYLPTGEVGWVARYDGPDHRTDRPTALMVDSEANVIVGGLVSFVTSYLDLAVVKYHQVTGAREGLSSCLGTSGLRATPNPFRDHTVITCDAPGHGRAVLKIYDVTGRCVRKLVGDAWDDGSPTNVIRWDGHDVDGRVLPPGVYFCRIQCGSQVKTAKVVSVE